jgi:tripartite motif-containing protein 71
MRRILLVAAIFAFGVTAFAGWIYDGQWGSKGTGNAQFDRPIDLAVTTNRVYVTDRGNSRVQYFSLNGNYIGKFGVPGSGNGQFKEVRYLDVASNGNIYVVDAGNNRIQYFRSNGTYLGKWGTVNLTSLWVSR